MGLLEGGGQKQKCKDNWGMVHELLWQAGRAGVGLWRADAVVWNASQ